MAVVRLEVLPGRWQTYRVADYVELRCVVAAGNEFLASDLVSARHRMADLGEPPLEDQNEFAGEEPVAPEPMNEAERADEHDPEVADDLRIVEAGSVWSHLHQRARDFGEAYPFEVDGSEAIRLRELSPARRFYLFLLIASNLRYLPKADESKLTRPFERLGIAVVRTHLPMGAEVHVFGTTAGSAARYKGRLWKRLQKLTSDLRTDLLTTSARINKRNVGDAGLDIVGWVPPGDEIATGMLTIFAQCTCSATWQRKLHEGTEDNWNRRMHFHSPVVNLMIIPFYFRNADGSWFDEDNLSKGVLVDRLRIVRSLQRSNISLPVSGCYPARYVQSCLDEEIDIAA
jgi:hypothetical protein